MTLGLVLAAALALPAGGGAAVALADGGNTSAVAINTQNGSSVFKLAFSIRQVSGSVVDNQNAAVAFASCSACQTVAISIQILLISGNPTVFTPTNLAIAINQNCNACDTLAAAYQFAVGIGTEIKFTEEGRREIAEIRRQLEVLRHSGLTGPEIAVRVKALMTQLSNVLKTELVGVNEPASHGDETSSPENTTNGGDGGSGTPTTTTTAPTPTSTGTTPETTTTPTSTGPTGPTTTSPSTTTSQ